MIALAESHPTALSTAGAVPAEATAANVLCVGISHHTAPVSLRERLVLSEAGIMSMLARFGCAADQNRGTVSELVVLSTCNRLELYASGGPGAPEALIALIEEHTGVPAAQLEHSLYQLFGVEAVQHLCRTAAGLDSMVIGEPQILGQVSNAFAAAVAQRAAAHTLSILFHGAIRAGRRARAETGINRQPATVSSVAVKFVADVVGDVSAARVLVAGAGEMAELAAAAFHQRGTRSLAIVSRTTEHAAKLAEQFGGRSVGWSQLADELAATDVFVVATGAPHHIITRDVVREATIAREAPLAIVDIAMPRNVDPSVRSLAHVSYWDLDDLQTRVVETHAERASEAPAAERVVEEESARCVAELRQLDVQPLIADLRTQMDDLRQAALQKALRGLSSLSPEDRARVEAFSESLVNRMFHEPMVRLRAEAARGQAAGYAMALRHLFGLEA